MDSPNSLLILGCGYLGRRVADRAVAAGSKVHAVTRSESRAEDLAAAGVHPVVASLPFDSGDSVTLPSTESLLWAVGFDRSSDRQTIWVEGVQSVVHKLDRDSPPRRFCLVSSVSVYGDRRGEAVDEMTEPAPTTESGRACLDMERSAAELLRQRVPSTQLTVLRLGGIYGPGRLLRRVESLRQNQPLPGTGSEWLNLIHVHDAATIIQAVLRSENAPDLINVVSPNIVTRQQYYALLAEQSGASAPIFEGNSASTGNAGANQGRQRSGNKRVMSRHLSDVDAARHYDDPADGLRQAMKESQVG